jgi:hypothetical protein
VLDASKTKMVLDASKTKLGLVLFASKTIFMRYILASLFTSV